MRMLIAKLFTILAISLLLTHNIVPHHHHDLIEATDDYHDDDQNHSFFSFGQIDDSFILVKSKITICSDFSSQLFLLPNTILLSTISFFERDKEYSTYQKFPPPENYQLSASLRAPPCFY